MDRQAIQERFGLFGDSPALRRMVDRIRQVAPVDITVLLEGESGAGKEVAATALHGLSARRHKRFVVVNCGAIPEGLIESELFGAEKGAYTGAVERRTGFFEEADGGTLFLDEIGEMPLQAQVRLLRVLETGQFSRVGSSKVQRTDARVVAATNKDLGAEVAAGRFREDLYYRLSAVVVEVPPLRERQADVVPLFERFARGFAEQYDAPTPRLTPDAAALLREYGWPGNVRELRNVAERTVVLAPRGALDAATLRPYLRGVSARAGLAPLPKADAAGDGLVYRALVEMRAEMREMRLALLRAVGDGAVRPAPLGLGPARSVPARSVPDHDAADLPEDILEVTYEPPEQPRAPGFVAADTHFEIEDDVYGGDAGEPGQAGEPAPPADLEGALSDGLPLPSIADAERALIREALRRFDGNRRKTADVLGISERTLYRKIKELDDDGDDA